MGSFNGGAQIKGLVDPLQDDLDANGKDIKNAAALEAESATIGNTLFENDTLSLADDVSGSVRVSQDQFIWVLGDSGGVSANFQSTFDVLNTIIVGGSVTNQGGAIVLNGTTGPDETVNISRDGNDLYIENRSGGSVTVDVLRLNR